MTPPRPTGAHRENVETQGYWGLSYLMVDEEATELYWLRKSAGNGYPYAQYNLGVCYRYGIGVFQSLEEAKY